MRVLISLTDVEPAVRLNAALEGAGVTTSVVSPLDDVRTEIKRFKPDVIVLTGVLTDNTNARLVQDALWSGVTVVGLIDVDDQVIIDRLRASGFAEIYVKPIAPEDLFHSIKRLIERQKIAATAGLIGQSEAIREVLVKIEQMAPVSSTVLIEGESGTGKELVARAIHRLSNRRGKPFIAVNVGALPDSLLESELFGHEKGSFTGAAERRIGRFELADEGTLFLDEIGEIPQSTQVKLLRVLEEREFMRVGGTVPIKVDVRVVAATNKPLRQCVEEGSFRSDLYYRLNVLSIYLPPLRERRDDIPLLVRTFVSELTARHDRTFHGISADAMQILVNYDWPGNVRELRNLIESMVVLAPGREIGADDIPRQVREGTTPRFLPVHVGPVVRETSGAHGRELEFILRSLVELKLQVEDLRRRVDDSQPGLVGVVGSDGHPAVAGLIEVPALGVPAPQQAVDEILPLAEVERRAIEAALRATKGNRRKAAELLQIGERTMYRKLRDGGGGPV